MIAVTFDKGTGRLASVIQAPTIDLADYETDDLAVIEYLGDELGIDQAFEWWVRVDYPIEGVNSINRVDKPSVDHYYWDWTVHQYVPNKPEAIAAANDRIVSGQNIFMYGTFTWAAKVFRAGVDDQGQIRSYALEAYMAQATSAPFTVDWRLADDSLLTLNAADMLAVFAAMQASNRAADEQANSLLASVSTAAALSPVLASITALNAIDWVAP